MMTDPIADMLTRIRNGAMAGHADVTMPYSNTRKAVAELLKAEGYVTEVRVKGEERRTLTIVLKYVRGRETAIRGMRRASKPGRRVYVGKDAIPRVRDGLGVAVMSTSKGVMSDTKARELGVGGEFLCEVW